MSSDTGNSGARADKAGSESTSGLLDRLVIHTDVLKRQVNDMSARSRDGCYVHGLSLEGARWDAMSSNLATAKPKIMFCNLPVILLKALDTGSKKALKQEPQAYQCPVYATRQRGDTYIFTAKLRTKKPPAKWILGGVVLLLDVID